VHMAKIKSRRPSDLPTKTVRSADGRIVRVKVVNESSETLGADLEAAFRSSVRSIRESRKRAEGRVNAANPA